MDPFMEQKLRDEVIYLHSLWHQGPPTSSNPNPNFNIPISNPNPYIHNPIIPSFKTNLNIPISNPNSHINYPIVPNFRPNLEIPISNPNIYINNNSTIPINNHHPYLSLRSQPSNPTNFKKANHLNPSSSKQFKKGKKKHRGRWGGIGQGRKWVCEGSDTGPVSDKEWPVNPNPAETSMGWPTLNLNPAPTRVLSAEEQARMVATQSQQKALKAAQERFANDMDSDGEVEDGDDDDDEDVMDDDGCEEYVFFLKLLMEDSELKSYYEKNWESGEFCCLVCCGIGQKVLKRFKNCVALVQHSVTIAKTKKRQAHRALGQAICKVLGWDIDRLPTIVLAKLDEAEGNASDDNKENYNARNSVNINNSETITDKLDSTTEVLPDKVVSLSKAVDHDSMVCEHAAITADGKKTTTCGAEGNEEGVVVCLCRNLTKRMVLEVPDMK